jgi:hypothetical protein
MATLDIFNNDAFSLSSLSQTITDIPRVPTQLGDERLFNEYPINTLSVMIERQGSKIQLVPSAPRGGVPQPGTRSGRKIFPLVATHLPQSDTILADEVQGVRAFGSETEVMAVSTVIKNRLMNLKMNLDLTMEYQRIGALKGQVLDANGSDVLWDMYTLFGFTQQTHFFALANAATDVKQKCVLLKRAIQLKLGGRAMKRVRVKVSESFFDALVGHTTVKKAWELWSSGAFARMDQSEGDFEYAGVIFQIYAGGTSAGDFITADLGYAYPEGIPGMFQIAYAPANFIETVNTNGLPYYAKQKVNPWETGVDLYTQSNPVTFNSLPEAVIKVSAAAS